MATRYSHILQAAYSTPWAIEPSKLRAIINFLQMKAAGGNAEADAIAAIQAQNAAAQARAGTTANTGTVAVLPLFGVITQRQGPADISSGGGTSLDKFTAQFRQVINDPGIKAVVLSIDSPGGTVSGCPELAQEIYNARSKKAITAVSDCLCASAAYWLGSACSDFVVSPSSLTGSIGVYSSHSNLAKRYEMEGVEETLISAGKFKTEGSDLGPLDPEARAAMQSMVDSFYGMFVRDVARGRGVSVSDVRNGFGQGRVVTAQAAVQLNMADRVGTLDQVLAKYGVSRGNSMLIGGGGGGQRSMAGEDERRRMLDRIRLASL